MIEIGTPNYQGNFWGDKNHGFDAMFQNMKAGSRTTSELIDFIKDFTNIEENYYKSIVKLNNKISGFSSSSFSLCWEMLQKALKLYVDRISGINKQRQSFLKDVQLYSDDQGRKQRAIKDDKSISETINAYRSASDQLNKSKETFHLRRSEYEKIRQNESISRRDLDRSESKLKKAQQDYKYTIEKYNNHRNQYINKMKTVCEKFQDIEENHLEKMLEFLRKFTCLSVDNLSEISEILKNYYSELDNISTAYLIKIMIDKKGTGNEEPAEASIDDSEIISLNLSEQTNDMSKDFSISNQTSPTANVQAVAPFHHNGSFKINNNLTQVTESGHQPRSSSAGIVNIDSKFDGSQVNLSKDHTSSNSQRSSPVNFNSSFNLNSTGLNSFTKKFKNRSNSTLNNNPTKKITLPEPLQNYSSINSLGMFPSEITTKLRNRLSKGRDRNQSENSGSSVQSGQIPMAIKNDWKTTSITEDFQVDSEGYRINPSIRNLSIHDSSKCRVKSSSSSSGSSSTSNEDLASISMNGKKLNIVIKPLSSITTQSSVTDPDLLSSNNSLFQPDSLFALNRPDSSSDNSTSQTTIRRPRLTMNPNHIQPLYALPPPNEIIDPISNIGLTQSSNSDNRIKRERPRPSSVQSHLSLAIRDPLQETNSLFNADFDEDNKGISTSTNTLESFANFDQFTESMNTLNNHFFEDDTSTSNTANQIETECKTEYDQTLVDLHKVNFAFGEKQQSEDHSSDSTQDETIDQDGNSVFVSVEKDAKDETENSLEVSDENFVEVENNLDESLVESTQDVPSQLADDDSRRNYASVKSSMDQNPDEEEYQDPQPDNEDEFIKRLVAFGMEKQQPKTIAQIEPTPFKETEEITVIPVENGERKFPLMEVSLMISEEWIAEFRNGGATSFHREVDYTNHSHQVFGKLMAAVSTSDAQAWLNLIPENGIDQLPEFSLKLTKIDRIVNIVSSHLGIKILRDVDHILVKIDPETFYYWLRKSIETSAPFIHLDVVNWSVDVMEKVRPPILLCTYWRCKEFQTDFRLDYSSCFSYGQNSCGYNSEICNNSDLTLTFQFTKGHVEKIQSSPICQFDVENQSVVWNLPLVPAKDINNDRANGTVSSTFYLNDGPGHPEKVFLKFMYEGTTPSGLSCDMVMQSCYFKLTTCRGRIFAKKYICYPKDSSG